MKKAKTLEEKIIELKERHKEEEQELALEFEIKKKLDFDFIVYNLKSIGFFSKLKYVKPNGVSSKADVRKIIETFPIGKENFVLGFVGRDSIETESPLSLRFDNYTHTREPSAKLVYKSIDGIQVSIEVGINVLTIDIRNKYLNPNSRAKNPETFAEFSIKDTGLECQQYATGGPSTHFVYHGKQEYFINLFQD